MNEELKAVLLNAAEDQARQALDSTYKILEVYSKQTETTLDDAVYGLLTTVRGWIDEQVDKIDGEVG